MQYTTSMLVLAVSCVWYLYVECFLMGFYHGSLQIPKYHKCISYSPLKISGRLFCYQETYRNPIRLRCQSEILRCKIIVCIYLNELLSVQPMILLVPIAICRSYFSPKFGYQDLVELMGTAPMSSPVFNLNQQIVLYL